MAAPPLGAEQVPDVRVADLEVPFESRNTSLDVQMDTQGDIIMTQAGLEENQVVNEVQDLKDVDQMMKEGDLEVSQSMKGVTLRSEDSNGEDFPGHANTRASLGDLFPPLDVGDAEYQSLLEENRLLRMRIEDLEEADKLKNEVISGLNDAIGILNEVIRVCVRN